jgi:serine/threonine protein kinase
MPPFIAPEVLTESEDCDLNLTKVDIYAFGMMIYKLFAGDKPWMRVFGYGAADPSKKLKLG